MFSSNNGMGDIGQILASMQDEVKAVKEQLDSLPMFPKGQYPSQFSKLHSQLSKFETALKRKGESLLQGMVQNYGSTVQELPNIKLPSIMTGARDTLKSGSQRQTWSRSVKSDLGDKKSSVLMSNPQNEHGQKILREKFNLPAPVVNKVRQCGQKEMAGKVFSSKTTKPQRILTKDQRHDPFAEPPPITDYDLGQGILNLVNRGMIPKEVDLTPAFSRGVPAFANKAAPMYDKSQQYVKQEVQSGPTFVTSVKMEMVPYEEHKALERKEKPQTVKQEQQLLALPAPPSQELVPVQPGAQVGSLQEENDKLNAREYNDLMDAYSLHQFMIRRGKTLDTTPEFLSYKRTYASRWGEATIVIHALEKLLGEYNVPLAYIDGKKVIKLAIDPFKKWTVDDLLNCVSNQETVMEYVKIPGRLFAGPNGKELAVTYISKTWRMYKQKKQYKFMKMFNDSANLIKQSYKRYKETKEFKERLAQKFKEELDIWRQMMQEFKERWGEIKKRRRVEIHINSISIEELKRMSMEKFLQRENLQITRLFALKNPLVEIIYVCPFDLSPEIVGYYTKVLEIGNIEHPETRFSIVMPDNASKLPCYMSTSTLLLYSPKTIKKIKSLIRGKQSYIVPGIVSQDDIKLSIALGVPIMSGEPQKSQLYSSKSGCRRIFNLADVPIPIGTYDIYHENEFEISLTKLILSHIHIDTWVFKIDDENSGRGTAWLEVGSLKVVKELRRTKFEANEKLIENVQQQLHRDLPSKAKIAMPSLYRSWAEYIKDFCKAGGVIEAQPNCTASAINSPSVAFMIEPDGRIEVIGSFDRFCARPFINGGCMYPQTSLPNINLSTICKAVGDSLYQKGVIGHVTVDLLAFPFPSASATHPLFWGIDINCWLTDYAAACIFFDFLMDGKLDTQTGNYMIDQTLDKPANTVERSIRSEPRSFVYCKYLNHPGLSTIQYKTFFHMCRVESVSFDLERRQGATFILCDSLQSGVISVMSIGSQMSDALKIMADALNFIQRQAGTVEPKANTIYDAARDQLGVLDVISKIRLMYKHTQKKLKISDSPKPY